ncbi:hypothetical protein Tco_1423458 [Tanacetum coccineum]
MRVLMGQYDRVLAAMAGRISRAWHDILVYLQLFESSGVKATHVLAKHYEFVFAATTDRIPLCLMVIQ